MIKIERTYGAIPDSIDNEIVENKIKEIVSGESEFSWEIIKDYDNIKHRLNRAYNEKCAFCEQKIALKDLEILHFRPYKGEDACNAYKSLAYEWSNFLLVCPRCKKLKGDKFKLDKNLNENDLYKNEILRKGEKRLPNNEPLKNEIPKLVNPETDNPEKMFKFEVNGTLKSDDARGDYTIEELRLDEDSLFSKRNKNINDFFNSIKIDTLAYLERDISKDIYIEKIGDSFQKLFKLKEPFYEFSAYTNYVINHFEKFALFNIDESLICKEINMAFKSYKEDRKIQLQEFDDLICNNIKNSINNTMNIDGNGNLSLQNVNGENITINYNSNEEIIKIIKEFRDSNKIENKIIAEHLEDFNSKIDEYRNKDISLILNNLNEAKNDYNSQIHHINTSLSQINYTLQDILQFLIAEFEKLHKRHDKHDSDFEDIKDQITKLENTFTSTLSPELKAEFENIKKLIIDESKENGEAIADALMKYIDDVEDKLTDKQKKIIEQNKEIYDTLKKPSKDWKTKVKISLPLIALLGIDIGFEYEKSLNKKIEKLGTRLKNWLRKTQ